MLFFPVLLSGSTTLTCRQGKKKLCFLPKILHAIPGLCRGLRLDQNSAPGTFVVPHTPQAEIILDNSAEKLVLINPSNKCNKGAKKRKKEDFFGG